MAKLNLEALEPRNAPSGAYFDQALGMWEGIPVYDPLHPQDGLVAAVAPASPAQEAATEAIMLGTATEPGMGQYYLAKPQTVNLTPHQIDQAMTIYQGQMELAWAGASMQLAGRQ